MLGQKKIRANYDDLESIQSRLQTQADLLQDLFSRIQTKQADLCSGEWLGMGANMFYAEMDDLVNPANQGVYTAILETSTRLQIIVELFRNAEQEAEALIGIDES